MFASSSLLYDVLAPLGVSSSSSSSHAPRPPPPPPRHEVEADPNRGLQGVSSATEVCAALGLVLTPRWEVRATDAAVPMKSRLVIPDLSLNLLLFIFTLLYLDFPLTVRSTHAE